MSLTVDNCALIFYYTASSGNFLPTFRYHDPEVGPIACPETSVRNYHYSLRNNSEERRSHLLRSGSQK